MIDTDKYDELTIDDWYKMNHHDWKDVVNEHNDLLAEVKRLREWKAEVERICRTMNGPNRDTALFIMTNEVEEE